MRLLVVAAIYPHPGHTFSGIFNRRCVEAAVENGHEVTAMVPKPYLPGFLSLQKRWAAYSQIPEFEQQGSVAIYRPRVVIVPRIASTFWRAGGAYWQCRRLAIQLHRKHHFDAIMSFDLSAAGGLAWRLGQCLGLPTSGWAFGLDVRPDPVSAEAKELRRMLRELDLIFYQSQELLDCARSFVPNLELDSPRHVVLPHGIPSMESRTEAFGLQMRERLKIPVGAIVILFLGRFVRGKGLEELMSAVSQAVSRDSRLFCIAVGGAPGFDDTPYLQQRLSEQPGLADRFQLLPSCTPQEIADYHSCADIFAFPSLSEGMPNALLEAMALGTPSVSFAIPPICEIPFYRDCMIPVSPFSVDEYADGLVNLAASADLRSQIAERARSVVRSHFDILRNVGQAVDRICELTNEPSVLRRPTTSAI